LRLRAIGANPRAPDPEQFDLRGQESGFNTIGFLAVLLLPPLAAGGWREGFRERFGSYSPRVKQALTNRRIVWIHAVSVGEVNLATLLVRALEPRLPTLKFVVSTTTTTGMAELRRKLPIVEKVYYPIDRRPWVRRAFGILNPEILILVEAELWPNFMLWQARRRRVPVVLVNARISDRSFPRYRRAGFLFRDLFAGLAAVSSQSDRDHPDASSTSAAIPTPSIPSAASSSNPAPPATSAPSTSPDSSARPACLDGRPRPPRRQHPRRRRSHPRRHLRAPPPKTSRPLPRPRPPPLRTGPRHRRPTQPTPHPLRLPQRGRLRRLRPDPGSSECLVVNSTGELRFFYPHAHVVFVGKSLHGVGGQNPIEPAAAGRPIVFGPHMQNFPDIAPRFLDADAALQVEDAGQLEKALDDLFSPTPPVAMPSGATPAPVVEANRGALDRTVAMIFDVLKDHGIV
jgi:3-deoxy-D-manno-octulosonic-acid transferase